MPKLLRPQPARTSRRSSTLIPSSNIPSFPIPTLATPDGGLDLVVGLRSFDLLSLILERVSPKNIALPGLSGLSGSGLLLAGRSQAEKLSSNVPQLQRYRPSVGPIIWPRIRRIQRTIIAHDHLYELMFRAAILVTVCILQLCVKPHKRHIEQDDLLRYYSRPRHPSIVPPWATVFIVICIPLISFALPEYLQGNQIDITHPFLSWTLALSINAFITEVMKLFTGRPRPDFLYRCFPDGKMNEELICTGRPRDVWEGRKSFPSGHSSFTFCSMGFVSAWLCGRLGVVRYWDNHHHVEDIIVGSILGLVVSFLSYAQYWYSFHSENAETVLPQTYPKNIEIESTTDSEGCTKQLLELE
ncbi:PAP2 superfamily domain-containing protein [Phthorimaea operculella]|nr:PAP2 superfamily domain-containing protein [Phthorimaea operculella]